MGYIKWALMFAAAAAAAFVIWQYTNLVSERAALQVQNEQLLKNEKVLNQALVDKDLMIELLQYIDDIKEEAITERDTQLEAIESQYSDIVNNSLGDDLDDQAAESLKELIRRLSNK